MIVGSLIIAIGVGFAVFSFLGREECVLDKYTNEVASSLKPMVDLKWRKLLGKKLSLLAKAEAYGRFVDAALEGIRLSGILPVRFIPKSSTFIVIQVIGSAGIALLVFVYEIKGQQRLWLTAVVFGVSWWLTVKGLKRILDSRKQKILFELPKTIDLLAMAMEAGLNFRSALRYLNKYQTGIVRDILVKVELEIDAGESNEIALKRAAIRSQSEDMKLLVKLILQAEKQGKPIKGALVDMSRTIRKRQRYQIAAKANKLPTTMLVPIFIFIVPPVMLIYTLPALSNLRYFF